MKTVSTFVVASNSEGSVEMLHVEVTCTEDQYIGGDHIDAARITCEDVGYDVIAAFDESEPAARQVNKDSFSFKMTAIA